jgi:hypothetical protein
MEDFHRNRNLSGAHIDHFNKTVFKHPDLKPKRYYLSFTKLLNQYMVVGLSRDPEDAHVVQLSETVSSLSNLKQILSFMGIMYCRNC